MRSGAHLKGTLLDVDDKNVKYELDITLKSESALSLHSDGQPVKNTQLGGHARIIIVRFFLSFRRLPWSLHDVSEKSWQMNKTLEKWADESLT